MSDRTASTAPWGLPDCPAVCDGDASHCLRHYVLGLDVPGDRAPCGPLNAADIARLAEDARIVLRRGWHPNSWEARVARGALAALAMLAQE